ncbi:haloacid dehalogenase-like hydrolase [Arthrobacter sp. A5]|uniref:haloacid dehalogenase-like hydrolase n=1 Tax=Arthrobacter sp. A5 TaxID=576926 RepID=UPI003DA9DAFC
MTSRQPAAAYFDVDGTVTPLTTMFELLRFDAANTNRLSEGNAFLAHLRELKLNGAPRQDTNRKYFTWWAGRRVGDVEKLGREWFKHALATHGQQLIHPEVHDRMLEHEVLGDRIVLVSGSFLPALNPSPSMWARTTSSPPSPRLPAATTPAASQRR